MNLNRVTQLIMAAAVLLLSFSLASAADKIPDATFDLTGGHGTDYPFSIKGLTVLDIGASKAKATGQVFNLSELENFTGSYSGVAAAAAMVYGASTGVMENHTGVVIRFNTDTEGAELKLAADTFEVKLR